MTTTTSTAERDRIDASGLFARGTRLVVAHIRSNPRPFWISVAGAFVFAVGSVLVTVALGRVTDRVIRPAFTAGGVPWSTIWLGVGAVMGLATLRAIGIGFRRYFSGVLGAAVGATLRDRVSDRYRDLALSYHRTQPTGELLAHMEADVEAAIEVLLGGVNLRHVDQAQLRRHAAVVLQESFLFANTVSENIALDSDATRETYRLSGSGRAGAR
jgi:ABC-type multidrug transport system fused ATPase/permease subunit